MLCISKQWPLFQWYLDLIKINPKYNKFYEKLKIYIYILKKKILTYYKYMKRLVLFRVLLYIINSFKIYSCKQNLKASNKTDGNNFVKMVFLQ